jgi:hypothetical protein
MSSKRGSLGLEWEILNRVACFPTWDRLLEITCCLACTASSIKAVPPFLEWVVLINKNYARGHHNIGRKHANALLEHIRRLAEASGTSQSSMIFGAVVGGVVLDLVPGPSG